MLSRPLAGAMWILALGLLPGCGMERADLHRSIDAVVRQDLQAYQTPGAAVIALHGEEVLYEQYIGLADVELGVPVTSDSVFAIASMSKAFTAAAVLLLERDGLLRLSDPVRVHLPEVPDAWRDITVRQLLDHSSGLPDDWSLHDDWMGEDHFFYVTRSSGAFLDALMQEPLAFAPGMEWRYGSGPFVAGMIIERVTGQPYATVMRERIFEPLGMRSTHIDDPSALIPHRVSGYLIDDRRVVPGMPISAAARSRGDVGVVTTARDMVLWIRAIQDGSLLGPEATAEMLTPVRLSDGSVTPAALGWFVVPLHGTEIVEHSGVFRTGYTSTIAWYPAEELVMIILTNSGGEGSLFMTAQRALACLDPRLAPIGERAVADDPQPQRLAELAKAVQAAGDGATHELLHPDYPARYFSAGTRRRIASTSALELIACAQVEAGTHEVLGCEVAELISCRARADSDFSTTLWLDGAGRIVFIDWPEAP